MRSIRKTLTGTGAILATLDPHKTYHAVSGYMYGDNAVNATAQVDATISDLTNKMPVTISRSTTTVTVTFQSNHYLSGTADYVLISGTGLSGIDGIWPVASVSSTTVLTFTSSVSGTVATTNAFAVPIKKHETVIASGAVSATTLATFAISATTMNQTVIPRTGLILNCTIYSAGTVILDALAAGL
jgi:hypothetical protein